MNFKLMLAGLAVAGAATVNAQSPQVSLVSISAFRWVTSGMLPVYWSAQRPVSNCQWVTTSASPPSLHIISVTLEGR